MSSTFYLNRSRSQDAVEKSVVALQRYPEFMNFFFQHLCGCPPHGPFKHYCVLTFMERANRRYGSDVCAAAPDDDSASEIAGVCMTPVCSPEDAAAIRAHLSTQAVAALIEKYYATRHLKDWPLHYVPGEVRLNDVQALIEQQGGSSSTATSAVP